MKLLSFPLTVLAIVCIIAACSTNPVTGRKQLNLVSADQEMQLGLSSFQKMKQEVPISRDSEANAMVQRVGTKIAAVAGPDMPNAQWEFVVFDSKEANAFCLPGGKVGVYTGLLPIAKDDAGLATVIGHEVAHAVSHHGAERMSQGMLLQTGEKAVGVASAAASAKPGTQAAVSTIYGLGAQLGYALPHSRKQESEADHIGLIYMARAGFEPGEAVRFWERFSTFNEKSGGGGTPWFLRTHPVDSQRIQQIQQWLPEARAQQNRGAAGPVRGTDVIGR